MSHHVTCHVTAMSCASSSSLKRKRKRNIKSRKIDKRKRKMLVSKVFYNTWDYVIDLREGFMPKKGKISVVKSRERRSTGVCEGSVKERIH